MTTLRTRLARILAVAALALGVVLAAAPAGADAGPGYPPAPGDDPVVESTGPPTEDTQVGEPANQDRPADEIPTDEGDDGGDEEAAAEGTSATGAPAPSDPAGRGVGPVLVIVAAAALLGGAVVAIARRI